MARSRRESSSWRVHFVGQILVDRAASNQSVGTVFEMRCSLDRGAETSRLRSFGDLLDDFQHAGDPERLFEECEDVTWFLGLLLFG